MRNNSTKQKGLKIFNFTLSMKVSSTTVWGYVKKKSWKSLKRKRRSTFHASLVSEGFANFIPKGVRAGKLM